MFNIISTNLDHIYLQLRSLGNLTVRLKDTAKIRNLNSHFPVFQHRHSFCLLSLPITHYGYSLNNIQLWRRCSKLHTNHHPAGERCSAGGMPCASLLMCSSRLHEPWYALSSVHLEGARRYMTLHSESNKNGESLPFVEQEMQWSWLYIWGFLQGAGWEEKKHVYFSCRLLRFCFCWITWVRKSFNTNC